MVFPKSLLKFLSKRLVSKIPKIQQTISHSNLNLFSNSNKTSVYFLPNIPIVRNNTSISLKYTQFEDIINDNNINDINDDQKEETRVTTRVITFGQKYFFLKSYWTLLNPDKEYFNDLIFDGAIILNEKNFVCSSPTKKLLLNCLVLVTQELNRTPENRTDVIVKYTLRNKITQKIKNYYIRFNFE